MPHTSLEIARAAQLAARRAEELLIEMLTNNEVGEVAVIVLSPYELKPVKRVETEGRTVKVARGHSVVDRV